MHRPWLASVVIIFWCLTTSWLVVAKIMPSLLPGSPPGYQALYASNNRLVPVAWTVLWEDRPLGWAVSESSRRPDGGIDVRTVLHFDRLPLDEVLPAWTKPLLGPGLGRHAVCDLEARGRLAIDPQGNLRSFHSEVELPGNVAGIVLDGTVEEGHVRLVVRAGDVSYETSRYLPSHVMIGDELSPQAMMPGLSPGKRWTVPVYNPLRGGGGALEILHAEVLREATMFWEDRLVRVDLVVYRDDPSDHHDPCTRLWVDRSGRVLRQQSTMLGANLAFLRRSDDDAERLMESLRLQEAATP